MLEVVARYRAEGEPGLLDRSLARRGVSPTAPMIGRCQLLAALRRLRFTAPELAELLRHPGVDGQVPCSSGSGWVVWAGSAFEPAQRYERERPGELIHIDVKKLGRIQGGAGKRVTGGPTPRAPALQETPTASLAASPAGTRVHVAVDDATRLAYAEVLPDEKAVHEPSRSCAARSSSTPATAHGRARDHRWMKVKWSGRVGLLCESAVGCG